MIAAVCLSLYNVLPDIGQPEMLMPLARIQPAGVLLQRHAK